MTSYDIIGDPANLVIGQGESKLFYSRLDRVPASKAVTSTPTVGQQYNVTGDPPGTGN